MTPDSLLPAAYNRGVGKVAGRQFRRIINTVANAAEVVRHGGLETDEEPSPFTVTVERLNFRLRHYFADETPPNAIPVVLVPPLMLSADVWDVSPSTSAVASLHNDGLDPWVVDFGDPGIEPEGLKRTLTDHVIAVSEAIDAVINATGQDVLLGGYSQGGMFCYQTAAYRRGKGLAGLVTFGSPVDSRATLPIPVNPELAARLADSLLETGLLRHLALPSWASRTGFKLLSPAKTVRNQIDFVLALHDRDSLLPREKQRRFLAAEGFTAWSGPAIAELFELFLTHNRMVEGGFTIEDRLVTLADIDVPILTVVGSSDSIGHPDSVRAIRKAAPRASIYELTLRAGHFGLVVGSTASDKSWPAVADWAEWIVRGTPLPPHIVPADEVEPTSTLDPTAAGVLARQALDVGAATSLVAYENAKSVLRFSKGLVSEVPAQLPRLARLGTLDPQTVMSLGLLLDEHARRAPEDIVFLFEDRAYRQSEVKQRVDNVVRGLIEVGIRHGDRVGVLMRTRPSAFTLMAALSRVGATAVIIRPDGDIRKEAELGEITWMISDPEQIKHVSSVKDVTWCVLGGGGEDRELDPRVVDMERIDPDKVKIPAWYRANPHRASDLAFILFTGEGDQTQSLYLTNHRWALSALGTASAARLQSGDTVYCTTPFHHSSALLMGVGGAIAGGARFAVASGNDPNTFWSEVRRYGATHVTYTWTSLRPVLLADPDPAEQHHPIRLFMGSGMPRNLWKRAAERFGSARVLEFYASVNDAAILANVHGQPIGSLGRPLPGTPDVRVASFDQTTKKLGLDESGLARECATDEVGLLLVKAIRSDVTYGSPTLRSVFEPDDAWRTTGDLFRRDEHGELWLVESVGSIIDTVDGPVTPSVARDALTEIPAVDICVTYGVNSGKHQSLVAALTIRPGLTLEGDDIERAVERIPSAQRPAYVQVVPAIKLTTWHRPIARPLRKAGVPKPSSRRTVWKLDAETQTYEQLS